MGNNPKTTVSQLPRAAGRTWQYAVAAGVLLAGAIFSSAIFLTICASQRDRARREFERASEDRIATLWKSLEFDLLAMRSVQSFFTADENITRSKFDVFIGPLVEGRAGIRSVQWAPCVRKPQRPESFPILWVEPRNSNVIPLGTDLATIPACREAMRRSRDTGQAAVTSKILLPNEPLDQIGLRLFLPVYRQHAATDTVEDRRKHLVGFVRGSAPLEGDRRSESPDAGASRHRCRFGRRLGPLFRTVALLASVAAAACWDRPDRRAIRSTGKRLPAEQNLGSSRPTLDCHL